MSDAEPPMTPAQARLGCLSLFSPLLCVVITLGAGWGLGATAGLWVGALMGWGLALLWLVVGPGSLRGWVLAASLGIGLVVPPTLSAFTAYELLPALRFLDGSFERVTLAEATRASSDPLEIEDGIVRSDLAHHTTQSRRNAVSYLFVAPLVAPSWTPAQPVAVWLGCSPTESRESDATLACRAVFAGSRLGRPDRGLLADAVAAAESRHGLRSSPDAVMLRLGSSTSAEAWATFGFTALLVFVAMGLAVALANRRER